MSEKALSNEEIVAKVNQWQTAGFVHEMTCAVDSAHGSLEAAEIDDKVVLVCTSNDCTYHQTYIPPSVLEFDVEASRENLQKLTGGRAKLP